LSWGELLTIAVVVAFVFLVFRRKWLVAFGRTPWSLGPRPRRERDDPRIRVKKVRTRDRDDAP